MKRQVHFPTLVDQPYFVFPESVGRYTSSPEHSVTRATGALNNFNIHYVAAGKGFVEEEGRTYTLQKGDAVFYFPMSAQRYYSSEDDPWDVLWVHFYGSEPLLNYMLERLLHLSPVWTLRQPSRLEEAHERLLDESERNKLLHPSVLSTFTFAVISEFVGLAEPFQVSAALGAADAYERIVRLLPVMQSEACEPFELDRWAESVGVSTYYFCKLFRKATQMTPMDFITRCRLQSAKQWLLERKEAAIGDIARDAGYPSASYFNKRFLEYEGMTPSQYRILYGKGV
jgi:AraC-like DNA-binding protein